jgi:hypothetical protein
LDYWIEVTQSSNPRSDSTIAFSWQNIIIVIFSGESVSLSRIFRSGLLIRQLLSSQELKLTITANIYRQMFSGFVASYHIHVLLLQFLYFALLTRISLNFLESVRHSLQDSVRVGSHNFALYGMSDSRCVLFGQFVPITVIPNPTRVLTENTFESNDDTVPIVLVSRIAGVAIRLSLQYKRSAVTRTSKKHSDRETLTFGNTLLMLGFLTSDLDLFGYPKIHVKSQSASRSEFPVWFSLLLWPN